MKCFLGAYPLLHYLLQREMKVRQECYPGGKFCDINF